MSQTAIKELMTIPGVGKSIAQDLIDIGINSVADLKGKKPEQLYIASCKLVGGPIDRCLLYVYRCAVYYASHKSHDPRLLKWWNWKDSSVRSIDSARRGGLTFVTKSKQKF